MICDRCFHSVVCKNADKDYDREECPEFFEMKHREWKTDRKEVVVRYGDEYEVHIPYCSGCGWKRSNVYEYLGPGKVKWNFCPECGADMRTKNVYKK